MRAERAGGRSEGRESRSEGRGSVAPPRITPSTPNVQGYITLDDEVDLLPKVNEWVSEVMSGLWDELRCKPVGV